MIEVFLMLLLADPHTGEPDGTYLPIEVYSSEPACEKARHFLSETFGEQAPLTECHRMDHERFQL